MIHINIQCYNFEISVFINITCIFLYNDPYKIMYSLMMAKLRAKTCSSFGVLYTKEMSLSTDNFLFALVIR
jgi:hypothetical protein